jgi:hypothetical protein
VLEGWRAQQLARNLTFSTIGKLLTVVGALTRHADACPLGVDRADANEGEACQR